MFAAVFFLKYSIESGWLQPPVRVAIGILVAIALLVVCELKAARRYPATANAMDAAAIAILFATFFAAHALWNLIPSLVTFALLAIVTALAVLLSIRRESLFIAVLGLLGGFATPALLSTGENRPIPLFAYLLLLNVGLAWVAYRQTLAGADGADARPDDDLSVGLGLQVPRRTAACRWRWAIFLALPAGGVCRTARARGRCARPMPSDEAGFEHTALVSAAMPLLVCLLPGRGPRVSARVRRCCSDSCSSSTPGFCAIAIARRQGLLHAAGAVATHARHGDLDGDAYYERMGHAGL